LASLADKHLRASRAQAELEDSSNLVLQGTVLRDRDHRGWFVSVAPQLKRAAEEATKTLHVELVEGATHRRDREPIRIWGVLGENLERAHPVGRQLKVHGATALIECRLAAVLVFLEERSYLARHAR
jgi:hypothetical protein